MIQLNLLPDVKLEFIKAQRMRRMILAIALVAGVASVAVLLLLLSVSGLQKKHLSDLNDDIKSRGNALKSKPEVNKVLTVQNQLASLSTIHAGKPAADRQFDFFNRVTPVQASITKLDTSFVDKTLSVTGIADSLADVNTYVDTLKFTTYKLKADKGDATTKAFSSIVLTSFALSNDGTSKKPATYTITMSYDPMIFDITQDIVLTVPKKVTTRSELPQADDLFQNAPATAAPATTKAGN